MKILLAAINAKYIHSNPAVYSLRAYAADAKERIEIAEYTINHRTDAILEDLYRRGADVIAFSCYIWNIGIVGTLLDELPKLMPETALWLGGPEVSYDAPQILRAYPALSGIMVGEGEETFRELAEYYCGRGGTLSKIAGLCLPGEGFTARQKPLSLDDIPFWYREYGSPLFAHRIVYYESSRGCPYTCSYCLSGEAGGVRLRSLEKVCGELQFFLDQRAAQVKFVDRTFNCNREHTRGIWTYLLEHDNGVTNFHFEVTADILTDEELELLGRMRPGLVQLEIGVQSVNAATLREIRRRVDTEKLKAAVSRIRAKGNVHIHLDLIAGLPYEDYDSFVSSFCAVYAMRPDQLQLGFLKLLKGSRMRERAREYGIAYRSGAPYEILCSKWLSYAQICRLKRIEEMVEIYYNSRQFVHTLAALVPRFANPFRMYEALADYWEETGRQAGSPSRAYRYEALFAFACRADGERMPLYRELLTYDMYLREKCKSRPAFARDLTPYRGILRKRSREKKEHADIFTYPVWETEPEKLEKKLSVPVMVHFCYEKRNALDHAAETAVEEMDEGEGVGETE